MTEPSDDALARLRAFASESPKSAEELNEATRIVRSICPDFAVSGIGLDRRASLTLRDGVRKEFTGRTYGDLLAHAAALITGKSADREDRRHGKGT